MLVPDERVFVDREGQGEGREVEEEVSDSNFQRIKSWLDTYVHQSIEARLTEQPRKSLVVDDLIRPEIDQPPVIPPRRKTSKMEQPDDGDYENILTGEINNNANETNEEIENSDYENISEPKLEDTREEYITRDESEIQSKVADTTQLEPEIALTEVNEEILSKSPNIGNEEETVDTVEVKGSDKTKAVVKASQETQPVKQIIIEKLIINGKVQEVRRYILDNDDAEHLFQTSMSSTDLPRLTSEKTPNEESTKHHTDAQETKLERQSDKVVPNVPLSPEVIVPKLSKEKEVGTVKKGDTQKHPEYHSNSTSYESLCYSEDAIEENDEANSNHIPETEVVTSGKLLVKLDQNMLNIAKSTSLSPIIASDYYEKTSNDSDEEVQSESEEEIPVVKKSSVRVSNTSNVTVQRNIPPKVYSQENTTHVEPIAEAGETRTQIVDSSKFESSLESSSLKTEPKENEVPNPDINVKTLIPFERLGSVSPSASEIIADSTKNSRENSLEPDEESDGIIEEDEEEFDNSYNSKEPDSKYVQTATFSIEIIKEPESNLKDLPQPLENQNYNGKMMKEESNVIEGLTSLNIKPQTIADSKILSKESQGHLIVNNTDETVVNKITLVTNQSIALIAPTETDEPDFNVTKVNEIQESIDKKPIIPVIEEQIISDKPKTIQHQKDDINLLSANTKLQVLSSDSDREPSVKSSSEDDLKRSSPINKVNKKNTRAKHKKEKVERKHSNSPVNTEENRHVSNDIPTIMVSKTDSIEQEKNVSKPFQDTQTETAQINNESKTPDGVSSKTPDSMKSFNSSDKSEIPSSEDLPSSAKSSKEPITSDLGNTELEIKNEIEQPSEQQPNSMSETLIEENTPLTADVTSEPTELSNPDLSATNGDIVSENDVQHTETAVSNEDHNTLPTLNVMPDYVLQEALNISSDDEKRSSVGLSAKPTRGSSDKSQASDRSLSMIESRAEILELLKESLSSDLVLDRIVSTLFASVLNHTDSEDLNANVDQFVPDNDIKHLHTFSSSDSEVKTESDFFEAQEEVEVDDAVERVSVFSGAEEELPKTEQKEEQDNNLDEKEDEKLLTPEQEKIIENEVSRQVCLPERKIRCWVSVLVV